MLKRVTTSGFRRCQHPYPYSHQRHWLHHHQHHTHHATTSTTSPTGNGLRAVRIDHGASTPRWTLEVWIAFVGIPMGLMGLLVEAYTRTELQNADHPVTCSYRPTSIQIQPHHVQQLIQNGIVVLSNVIPDDIIHQARQEGRRQFMTCMEPSANDIDVRQDYILWVQDSSQGIPDDANSNMNHSASQTNQQQQQQAEEEKDQEQPPPPPQQRSSHTDKDTHKYDESHHEEINILPHESLLHCIRFIRGVDYALEEAGYYINNATNTTTTSTTRSGRVVPQQCQLAFYPGNQHASYKRHLDTCIATIYELGLLEWWRLSDYRQRVVTVILYLNDPDRLTDDGGALRCWIKHRNDINNNSRNHHQDGNDDRNDKEEESSFDIVPKGGTLVIFQSDLVEHMVLPSKVDRYALTNWISDTTH